MRFGRRVNAVLLQHAHEARRIRWYDLFLYITMFVGGLFGNYFYYKKCINTIKKIKARNLSEADTNTAIEQAGGVSKIAVCLAIGALFVVSYFVVYLMNNL